MSIAVLWHFWVRGRLATRYQLADDRGVELGELVRRGWSGDEGRAIDPDGVDWALHASILDASAVAGDRTVALRLQAAPEDAAPEGVRARGDLRAGDRRFAFVLTTDGSRIATATDNRGDVVLDVRPSPHRGGPFLDLTVASALPERFAVAMAVSFLLVRIDAETRRGWAQGAAGSG